MIGLEEAGLEVKAEYHQAASQALLDEDGNDFLAAGLGLPLLGDFEAPGLFEGVVNPGVQPPSDRPAPPGGRSRRTTPSSNAPAPAATGVRRQAAGGF